MELEKRLIRALSPLLDSVAGRLADKPLPERKLALLRQEAAGRQMADVLSRYGTISLLRAERTLYRDCAAVQEAVLMDILRANAQTEYGRKHHFDRIAGVRDYRETVPVIVWEDVRESIDRMLNGEEDLLFPGSAVYFFRTSGTTGAAKFIPESAAEAAARKVTNRLRYAERVLASSLRSTSCIFAMFSRSSDVMTPCGIPAGNSSGHTAGAVGGRISRRYAYTPRLVEELEGNELYYTMMRLALTHRDVSMVSVNNARMLSMLVRLAEENAPMLIADIRSGTNRYPLSDEVRRIEEKALRPNPRRADELERLYRRKQFTPRYYWKDLALASFWLGGSVGVFVDEVRPLLPEGTCFMDVGYGASEAKINIPLTPDRAAGPLSIFSGFFEFIPEEGGKPLLAHELEDGKTYEIMLTTYGGLYRYRIEDYVRVEGFTGTTPNICFLTKSSDVANLVEEKIAGALLANAVRFAAEQDGLGCRACQVYPDEKTTRYVICLETERVPEDVPAFAEKLDQVLCEQIAIYEVERHSEQMLLPCTVQMMKKGWADHLTEKAAKGRGSSAQIKTTVVICEMPESEWQMK